MKDSRARWWLIAIVPLMLLAALIVFWATEILLVYRDLTIVPDPTSKPWYAVLGLLVSASATLYCCVELARSAKGVHPLLARSLMFIVTLAALVTSCFCTYAGARMHNVAREVLRDQIIMANWEKSHPSDTRTQH
jgi:hypothetical protein